MQPQTSISVTSSPLCSTTGSTSDRQGKSPPGKMYLRMNGLTGPGSSGPADRMQHADAVIRQQGVYLVEEFRVIPLADMLEHAD